MVSDRTKKIKRQEKKKEKDLKKTKENNKNCTQVPQSNKVHSLKEKNGGKGKTRIIVYRAYSHIAKLLPICCPIAIKKGKNTLVKLKRTLFIGARSSFFCFP